MISPVAIETGAWAFAGAFFGSFANAAISRLPIHETMIHTRSHCPYCKGTIKWYDLVPIISFIILGGRCRRCRGRIPIRYPIVEVVTAAAFAASSTAHGGSMRYYVAAWLLYLVIVAFIDIETRLILNRMTYPGLVAALILSPMTGLPTGGGAGMRAIEFSLIGALLLGGGVFLVARIGEAMTGKEAMGMGDVKLGFVLGALLGPLPGIMALMIGAAAGALAGLPIMAIAAMRGTYRFGTYMAFGPFMALGAAFVLIFGIPEPWASLVR